jgi:GTP-binding protein
LAFRRERFIPNTLVHFHFDPEHKVQHRGHGLSSNCSGSAGEGTTLKVPLGTLFYDDAGEHIHDFARPNETIVIAKGRRGGCGN